MDKIKIAFDPSANIYEDYKELVSHIFIDLKESIELFSISKTSNSIIVDIDSDNIFLYSTTAEVISKLSLENINIYLSNDKALCDSINNSIPLNLDNLRGCEAIFVDNGMMNAYKVKRRYVEHLDFWTNQISKIKYG